MKKYLALLVFSCLFTAQHGVCSEHFTDPIDSMKFFSADRNLYKKMHTASKAELIEKIQEGVQRYCEVVEKRTTLLLKRRNLAFPSGQFKKAKINLDLSPEYPGHTLTLDNIGCLNKIKETLDVPVYETTQISLKLFDLWQVLNLEEFQLYHLEKLQGQPLDYCLDEIDLLPALKLIQNQIYHHPAYRESLEEDTLYLETDFWAQTGKKECLRLNGKSDVIPLGSFFRTILEFEPGVLSIIQIQAYKELLIVLTFLLNKMREGYMESPQPSSMLITETSKPKKQDPSKSQSHITVIATTTWLNSPTRQRLQKESAARSALKDLKTGIELESSSQKPGVEDEK